MSLFKARDWWSTYAGSDEEFDLGCLCVANIDNNSVQLGKLRDFGEFLCKTFRLCCCLYCIQANAALPVFLR